MLVDIVDRLALTGHVQFCTVQCSVQTMSDMCICTVCPYITLTCNITMFRVMTEAIFRNNAFTPLLFLLPAFQDRAN